MLMIEGSLEVPTLWTDEAAEVGRVREEKEESRRSEKRTSQKKEDAGAREDGQKHGVFPVCCGSGGSKSRLAKAVGEEPSGEMRDEKSQAVVARSRCGSQNASNIPFLEQFWKLRCRKSAHGCGAKRLWK